MKTLKIFLVIVLLAVGYGAYNLWFKKNAPAYELATATRGTIVQEVSVTGNTAPVQNLDLAFENGGTVAIVNAQVGDHVREGGVIARLATGDLEAQLAQAKANVDTQVAKLKSLRAGSRPEDIQASRAALAKAQQDLANMYANVGDVLTDAYAKANDAVRNQLAPLFLNGEIGNPLLTFAVGNTQTLSDAQAERVQASVELNRWQAELAAMGAATPSSTLDGLLEKGIAHLAAIKTFLLEVGQTLTEASSLSATPAATLNSYKTLLTAALSETNGGATNVNGAAQTIASQKIAIDQLRAQLDLKVAGSTPEDIAAQQAQVEEAQANAVSVQVKIAKASLISPISGVVTVENAKPGQIASPGAILVSIISDQGLEVDANIPEADIGKVRAGNPVAMTLDAFPGRTFRGKISYVDPGETVIEGVPTYKTKFVFDDLGPEVKPGMTANLDITAATHDGVIRIPQRAVKTDASGRRTVAVYHGANQPLETRTVTVGLRDVSGNIEIPSGLGEGDVVVSSPL